MAARVARSFRRRDLVVDNSAFQRSGHEIVRDEWLQALQDGCLYRTAILELEVLYSARNARVRRTPGGARGAAAASVVHSDRRRSARRTRRARPPCGRLSPPGPPGLSSRSDRGRSRARSSAPRRRLRSSRGAFIAGLRQRLDRCRRRARHAADRPAAPAPNSSQPGARAIQGRSSPRST